MECYDIRNSVKSLCICRIHEGLTEGLSHFSGPSRTALIYFENPEDPVRIYDPQGLLRGHEPKLRDLYRRSGNDWGREATAVLETSYFGMVHPIHNLQLAGLISFGGRTRSVFHQMWFTEHHPDCCDVGPTERWMEHAICLLSYDLANDDALYTATSRYVLREYATHAVRDYIRDELNRLVGWDVKMEIYPILDAIIAISKTPEEGAWPRGRLVFIESDTAEKMDYLVRFPKSERPRLTNFKHVRKMLLAVEYSGRELISDGTSLIGVTADETPRHAVKAEFRGNHGFLFMGTKPVCSFSDGRFHSTNRKPNLVQLEELLLESSLDPSDSFDLFRILSSIVGKAAERKHGCTLVVDFSNPLVAIPGQKLEHPIDIRLPHLRELAESLSKVDGAVHIDATGMQVHAFACLLDGQSISGEDRSRGARYNSALRFTSAHKNLIVVVVSSDRPVSVMYDGVAVTAQCEWCAVPNTTEIPPTLEEWLDEA